MRGFFFAPPRLYLHAADANRDSRIAIRVCLDLEGATRGTRHAIRAVRVKEGSPRQQVIVWAVIRALMIVALLPMLAISSAGAQTTVATGVADDATSANSQPKLGRDKRGSVYLTFVKSLGGFAQVFVASSPDGATWRVQQVSRGTVDSRFPTLAVGPDEHVHLAWTQYTGGIGKVYYSRFDGRRWRPAVRLSPGEAYAGVPSIAIDPAGNPHVVWYGIRNQAPALRTRHGSIYEILYGGASAGRWTEPVVISPGVPDSINPGLAADASGTLHSAWYQFDLRTYQVRYTRRGATWEHPQQVSTGGDDATAVALAAAADGSVYLVWQRQESAGSRIYFVERHTRWSGQEAISPPGRPASDPSVAVDTRGRVYVAWENEGTLHLRRRDRQWSGVERIASQGRNTHPVLGATGDAVDVMWRQQVGVQSALRFATIAGSSAAPAGTSRSPWGIAVLILILLAVVWQYRRMRQTK